MSIQAKLAAAIQRANGGPGNGQKKKSVKPTPMQVERMPVKMPTAITQNRPTGLVGVNQPAAPAPATTSTAKSKADYKAENAAAKLENRYARKAANRSYRQEKSAAKREMELDRIKSGESKNIAGKVEKTAAAAGTLLGLVEGFKKAFPGKKPGQGQNQNPG